MTPDFTVRSPFETTSSVSRSPSIPRPRPQTRHRSQSSGTFSAASSFASSMRKKREPSASRASCSTWPHRSSGTASWTRKETCAPRSQRRRAAQRRKSSTLTSSPSFSRECLGASRFLQSAWHRLQRCLHRHESVCCARMEATCRRRRSRRRRRRRRRESQPGRSCLSFSFAFLIISIAPVSCQTRLSFVYK